MVCLLKNICQLVKDYNIEEKNIWQNYVEKPIQYDEISGDHDSIFKEPNVISFAKKIEIKLANEKL